MKTTKIFCGILCFLCCTIFLLGQINVTYAGEQNQETALKHNEKEFSDYKCELLEDIIKRRLFLLGYTIPLDIFVQNNRFKPCIERSIRMVKPNENGSFLNANVIKIGILVRVFKDKESLKKSISLDRKFKPPYWDEGVVMIIEIDDSPFFPGLSFVTKAVKRNLDGQIVDLSTETLGLETLP